MGIERLVRRGVGYAIALAATALISCAPGNSAAIRDGAALKAALDGAKGGETFRLAAASFGDVALTKRRFEKPVTLVSDDAARPATLERVRLSGVSGLHFRDLAIGGPKRAGEPEFAKLAEIRDSADIRLDGVHVHGSLDKDPGNDIWGVLFSDCADVTVMRSRFEEVFRALVFQRARDVEIAHNSFTMIRSDGIDIDSVQTLRIDGNRFSSFHPVRDDHADAIQFWNINGPPSTDITVSNNVLLEGEGTGPQGIFISTARSGRFQRVRVLNNLLYSSGAWHGILVEGADDVVVRGNTTLSRRDDDKIFWINLTDVSGAELDGNVTERVILKNVTGLTMGKNLDLEKSPGMARKFKDIGLGAAASAPGLVMPGIGYQPVAGEGGK